MENKFVRSKGIYQDDVHLITICVVATISVMGVERGMVVGLGLPGAVKVVSHDIQKVEVPCHSTDVVGRVDGILASGHCCSQYHPVGAQCAFKI